MHNLLQLTTPYLGMRKNKKVMYTQCSTLDIFDNLNGI